jgi:hypothetical protein
MPGPTPFYPSNAARQRAYRKRRQAALEEESRFAEATSVHAYALQAAVEVARHAPESDPLAAKVYRDDPIELLRALIEHFHDQAGTPAHARPWFAGPTGGSPPEAPRR